ncbi:MAG: methylenetetrahydrofolate--tRNA-(uracil(54)-C(5)) -methyltransferase (FADH(2)-oxidizing) TrmFO [Coriobacteriia bacterium]
MSLLATVIGGGLAGSEAAWQLACRGVNVTLIEMRPGRMTPAHHGDRLAELVCSNSMKSADPHTAAGLLKREMEELGGLLISIAKSVAVPAGAALAVDREEFARSVTEAIEGHGRIRVVRAEADSLPEGVVVLATGPLTSPSMEKTLTRLVGPSRLAFFDAAAPIVDADSIDTEVAFAASRYGKGTGRDYLNCPMDERQYQTFLDALLSAERATPKDFEASSVFEACLPIEELAQRGPDALRFGPLKPVGLTDPRTGRRPFAVVQLRAENRQATAYNLVGFQTSLTFPEQRRVFRLIPGLEHAEFLRYGVMHRNTFIDAPRLMEPDLSLASEPRVFVAGQLSGTEGYMEAAATGLLAGINAYARAAGIEPLILPPTTALGSLVAYATDPDTQPYQPMHVNFGLVPPLDPPVRGKRARYRAYSERALRDLRATIASRPDLLGTRATSTGGSTSDT